MIAVLGALMYDAGVRQGIEDTLVRQKFRTDAVEVSWLLSEDAV
jgi:tRNA A37 threonylcarbamoyltransferase TsaD